jgi:hypothetical protein
MSANQCLLAVFSIFIAGCSSSTMTVDSFDGSTGKSTHKVYSKYYDAGAWAVPKRLGMSVVVDHEKRRVPVASDVQQSLGALGPGDSFAIGKVTVYVWNFDSQPHAVTIRRVTSGGESFAPASKTITAAPHQKNGDEVGHFRIFNYPQVFRSRWTTSWMGSVQVLNLNSTG